MQLSRQALFVQKDNVAKPAVRATGRMLPEIYVPPSQGNVFLARLAFTLVCLLLLVAVLGYGAWLDSSAATVITLSPALRTIQKQVATTTSLRHVQATSATQQLTVATSGQVHIDARAAHGILTLYNGAPDAIPVPAGTTIPVPTGGNVVIDENVTVPHINYQEARAGFITAPAHMDSVGVQGNIAPNTLRIVICCDPGGNIRVSNLTAFTGGQDAAAYETVTNEDVGQATASLENALNPIAQSALRTQVGSDESLMNESITCRPQVQADHTVGTRAEQVTVTGQTLCQGWAYAYSRQQAQADVRQQEAQHPSFPVPYVLASVLILHVQAGGSKQERVVLSVTVLERWLYQWSQQRLQELVHSLAGLSVDQAQRTLDHTDGIQSHAIRQPFFGGNSLSSDPKNISVVVLPPAPMGQ